MMIQREKVVQASRSRRWVTKYRTDDWQRSKQLLHLRWSRWNRIHQQTNVHDCSLVRRESREYIRCLYKELESNTIPQTLNRTWKLLNRTHVQGTSAPTCLAPSNTCFKRNHSGINKTFSWQQEGVKTLWGTYTDETPTKRFSMGPSSIRTHCFEHLGTDGLGWLSAHHLHSHEHIQLHLSTCTHTQWDAH